MMLQTEHLQRCIQILEIARCHHVLQSVRP